MRVGIYVDGFNLYYGGRTLCGKGTAGWRWLDLRALATRLVSARQNWSGATIERVVYCTAMIDPVDNPGGHRDQDRYIKALTASGSVDHIELGRYISRIKKAPLAIEDPTRTDGHPLLWSAQWPLMVRDRDGAPVHDATFMGSFAHREEKGSDVNVATHLLIDVMGGAVDAAVVISNDSDLSLPIRHVRNLVPLGTVNPNKGYLAGALRGTASDGVGRHWWRQLTTADLRRNQLPDPAGPYVRPDGW